MPVTDPIADLLARIKNAQMVHHLQVDLPASKTKVAVANILKKEGYVSGVETVSQQPQDVLRVHLAYDEQSEPAIAGLRRVSKPGLRVYVQKNEVPRAFGGVGISIVSTSKGIMTGRDAYRQGVGGELMAYVW